MAGVQSAASHSRAVKADVRWRTAVAAIVIGAAGILAAYAATDGFAAYTLESARRLKALRSPATVPADALELADGGRTNLHALGAPVLLIDFIYTRCDSYCAALGGVFAQLQQRLGADIAAGRVRLVSVSFDPGNDDPAALASYRERHRGDAQAWILGRPANSDLPRWLDAFGVVVIRDELGGYAHNAAVHVVGPTRKLVAIHDLGDVDAVVASARAVLDRTADASAR